VVFTAVTCDKDVAVNATRFVGAALGLLAFSVSVLAGVVASNPVTVILSRGILSLFGFFIVGLLVGHLVQRVLADPTEARSSVSCDKHGTDGAAPVGDAPSGGSTPPLVVER
jgi:hypothetical protein